MSRPTEPVPTPLVVNAVAAGRADLVVAECSLRYNYLGEWRGESFAGYGVAPHQGRIDLYLRP